jgi:hypothetical protein
MSLNTQAVIPGHLGIEEVCRILTERGRAREVVPAPRYRPEHWEVTLVEPGGANLMLDVFLRSWAAEDYADVWQGPSTLLSCVFQPAAVALLATVARSQDGMMRANESDPWTTNGASSAR